MSVIKGKYRNCTSTVKEHQIKLLLYELEECNLDIKKTSLLIMVTTNQVMKKSLMRNLEAYTTKKYKTIKKLKSLGFSVEKRGRPTKPHSEKYSTTHTKFTAMLTPNNLDYVKQLKANNQVKNISSFLDMLIENYAKDNPL